MATMPLRVLMLNRPVKDRGAHGDWIQLLRTRDALRALGVDAEAGDARSRLEGYDVIHLFNLNQLSDTYLWFRRARRLGLKIALSGIWHPFDDMRAFYAGRFGWRRFPLEGYLGAREAYYRVFAGRRLAARCLFDFRGAASAVARGVDILLPNSRLELCAMGKDLGIPDELRHRIIPNAVEADIPPAPGGREKLIVCAGRIERNKNQVLLAKAFLETPALRGEYRLVFIGSMAYADRPYRRAFLRLVDGARIRYLGALPHDRALDLYARSVVAVLPSHFETTGLSGLEALKAGAQVVVTARGFTREYFRDYARYCDPYDKESLKQAVMGSLESPLPGPEPEFWEGLTWPNAARLTLQAYEEVLG